MNTAPPPSGAPGDAQYERMQRHLSRRALGVTLVSVAVGAIALLSVPDGPAVIHRQVWVPSSGPGPAPQTCSAADLAKPTVTAMPTPKAVTAPMVIHPAPDLERLSPPDSTPAVGATQAWEVMRRRAPVTPTTAGTTEVLLGDLYAATPAVEVPGGQPRPVFSHRLVWAIYDSHQPEQLQSAHPDAAPPACYFESAVFYVDAMTGRALVAEVFPPGADPATDV